jgi:hypothetical protein
MLEGAIAHYNGPSDLSQQFTLAVDVPSFLLFGPVNAVCSLYIHSLHCIVRMDMQHANFFTPVPYIRMLHTRIHDPLRKEHAL